MESQRKSPRTKRRRRNPLRNKQVRTISQKINHNKLKLRKVARVIKKRKMVGTSQSIQNKTKLNLLHRLTTLTRQMMIATKPITPTH